LKPNRFKIAVILYGLSLLSLFTPPATLFAAAAEVPVKGMVTLVDLGAGEGIPCKMMAPSLAKLEKRYAGKAAVVFLDV